MTMMMLVVAVLFAGLASGVLGSWSRPYRPTATETLEERYARDEKVLRRRREILKTPGL